MVDSEIRNTTAMGCTCLRLRKAARRVTQIFDAHLLPEGLTVTQYGLLGHLKSLDGISLGVLARKLIMDPTTLTRTLRPLERRGLLVVARDPQDRRSRRLHLTDEGRRALASARPAWARAQRQIERALGQEEAFGLNAALDAALDKLRD